MLENEGMIPFCPKCGQYRFPMYNVAVSMIVISRQTGRILLIKQYGRPSFILVAGYVNRTERLEHAVAREIKEETGMTVSSIRFNLPLQESPSSKRSERWRGMEEETSGIIRLQYEEMAE